jgi:curli biogenesis system outer membrane secretion channel CsgG
MKNIFGQSLSVMLAALMIGAIAMPTSAGAQEPRRLKLRVAVAPIEWQERFIQAFQIPAGFTNEMTGKLAEALLKTGRFDVMEREEMENLLNERELMEENTGQSLRGRIIPAQALIRVRVNDFELNERGGGGSIGVGPVRVGGGGSEARVGLGLRVIDTTTGRVLAAKSAEGVAKEGGAAIGLNIGSFQGGFEAFQRTPLGKATTTAINKAVEEIVQTLSQMPWQARVADFDASSKEVTINAGSNQGVRVGDVFVVERVVRVITDPDTGEVLGSRTERAGTITIIDVQPRFAVGKLEGESAQRGDLVRER